MWTLQSHDNPYPWYTTQGLLLLTWKYACQSQNGEATRERLSYFNFCGTLVRPQLGIGRDPIADELVALMDRRNTGSRLNPRTAAWVHDFSAMLFRKLLPTSEALEILVKGNLAFLLGEDPALLLGKDENFTNIVRYVFLTHYATPLMSAARGICMRYSYSRSPSSPTTLKWM
jgi:hypothetical protein